MAGETRSVAELEDDASWSSYWEGKALFHAAAELLGDPHAMRLIGEDVARADRTNETAALLRSLGSPGEVLAHIAQAAAKFCTVVRMEPIEIGPRDALIGATSVDGLPALPTAVRLHRRAPCPGDDRVRLAARRRRRRGL